ncbi:MAG: phospholipase D-like domain-containing protein [Gemmobacter sp.]
MKPIFRVLYYPLYLAALVTVAVQSMLPGRRDLRAPVPPVLAASDGPFLRTMDGLFGAALVPGNRVETLLNGDRIFGTMLEAIRSARTSINFETYVYWRGAIAETFAEALSERARAGVEVRVLLDWAGSLKMSRALIERMQSAGVRVVQFRPIRWHSLHRVNHRTHRKLLVVDGTTGFTGGVGIGEEWTGDARSPSEWRDTHFRVTGPLVAQMQGAFAENWIEETGEVLQGDAFFPPLADAGPLEADLVLGRTGQRTSIHLMLMIALSAARDRIRICTPYFVPDDVAIDQLLEARRRGVQVDILVPGPHNDAGFVRSGSRRFWGPLLRAGVRIWEYQPTFIHAKMIVIDDCWSSIGSSNFDERSFRLNDEANLNVFDRGFAAEMIEIFEADLACARRIRLEDWEARPLVVKIGDWLCSRLRPVL